jgi:hypothetical protein
MRLRLWTTLWPWISLIVAAVAVVSPFGQDLIHTSFFSGEQLARDLSQLLLYIFTGSAVALIALECLIRWLLLRKRPMEH